MKKQKLCPMSDKPSYGSGDLLDRLPDESPAFNPVIYDTGLYQYLRLWACCRQGRRVIDADILAVYRDRSQALQFCRQHNCALVRFDSNPY